MANKLIVSDAGPLISMMKIARLDLLHEMFGEVVVPRTVYNEVTTNKKFPSERKMIESASFITVTDVANETIVQDLMNRTGIHRGEAEAIRLVEEKFGKEKTALLIDDGDARVIASRVGIHIIGTIGTLEKAFREHRITEDELAQYADIFETTKRYYSEDELNYLRHPKDRSLKRAYDFKGVAETYNTQQVR